MRLVADICPDYLYINSNRQKKYLRIQKTSPVKFFTRFPKRLAIVIAVFPLIYTIIFDTAYFGGIWNTCARDPPRYTLQLSLLPGAPQVRRISRPDACATPQIPLLTFLQNEYHMISTVQPRVGQTLMIFQLESPSLDRDRRFSMTAV